MPSFRALGPAFTSTSPQPKLMEGDVKETKATVRYSVAQLQSMGRVIDPEGLLKTCSHWQWIANPHSSPDVMSAKDRAELAVEEMYRWKLMAAGMLQLVDGDFDTVTPIPESVERIGFVHDLGHLMGLFRNRLTNIGAQANAVETNSKTANSAPASVPTGVDGKKQTSVQTAVDAKKQASVQTGVDMDAKKQASVQTGVDVDAKKQTSDAAETALKVLATPSLTWPSGMGDIMAAANPGLPRATGMRDDDVESVCFHLTDPTTGIRIRVPDCGHIGQFFGLAAGERSTSAPFWTEYQKKLSSACGVVVSCTYSAE